MIIFSIMTVISITLIIVAVIKSSNIRDEQRHKRQEYFIDKYGDNIINILIITNSIIIPKKNKTNTMITSF